ncbi:acyltransferase [Brevundimonas sp.]|jgi:acetyltransferase-like isoleucine patch superfamily enzyme|uniref:acyltransferase n=1 Tax=Brevundimonas sp. TaxID=1871086 RepID=UPI003918E1E1
MAWLSESEMRGMGFRRLGDGVRISDGAKIYRPENISIGDHCRIDDFAILTPAREGHLELGSRVHISAYCMIEAPVSVVFEDFSGLAGRVSVYGSSDDYLGRYLTNPCVPMRYRKVSTAPIRFGRHAIIGASSVILPGAQIGEGCAVGALSLVSGTLQPWGVYVGSPARRRAERSRDLLELERALLAEAE